MRRPLHHTAGTDGPMFHAVKLAGPQSGMPFDGITYYVVKTAAHGDKRSLPRWRTRLRSGKILDRRNRFLIDCQVYDRSGTGARLRLFADVSLPAKIWLFEDAPERLIDARVVWRRDREIGIWFVPGVRPRELTVAQLAFLRAGYNPARK